MRMKSYLCILILMAGTAIEGKYTSEKDQSKQPEAKKETTQKSMKNNTENVKQHKQKPFNSDDESITDKPDIKVNQHSTEKGKSKPDVIRPLSGHLDLMDGHTFSWGRAILPHIQVESPNDQAAFQQRQVFVNKTGMVFRDMVTPLIKCLLRGPEYCRLPPILAKLDNSFPDMHGKLHLGGYDFNSQIAKVYTPLAGVSTWIRVNQLPNSIGYPWNHPAYNRQNPLSNQYPQNTLAYMDMAGAKMSNQIPGSKVEVERPNLRQNQPNTMVHPVIPDQDQNLQTGMYNPMPNTQTKNQDQNLHLQTGINIATPNAQIQEPNQNLNLQTGMDDAMPNYHVQEPNQSLNLLPDIKSPVLTGTMMINGPQILDENPNSDTQTDLNSPIIAGMMRSTGPQIEEQDENMNLQSGLRDPKWYPLS